MNILHIDCSPRADSHSRRLSAGIVAQLMGQRSEAQVTRRDLGQAPIPHTQSAYATTLSSPGALAGAQASAAVQLSEQLIGELESADVVVIGMPMNNFTMPSVFKAWVDQILRMGRTIGATPTGEKIGLLEDKPVYIGVASGGVYVGENARQPDFLTPYVSAAFACVGLTSLQFLPLQATAFLDREQTQAATASLLADIDMSLLGGAR
ncbi:FMN-dependent NADH-azoreductase [Massilia sp. HP4]|uniref:FMN-dependent NADH-azoreductase n=1 Tax=Massilia sp. HP4 TaxID=2562316 RepID=UPI0010C06CCD|nr:NAD(P)H-dependent oxidoreductase [Massilia sp. HP4]